MTIPHVQRETRKADLTDAYESGSVWRVDESLYPETRGYVHHTFLTEGEAHAFIERAK